MLISFTEPTAPRYISINQQTNQVHLMVPAVSGLEISTDNTCRATFALQDFFHGGARHELNAYKNALEFDIQLLEERNPQRLLKEDRLAQIEVYLEAIQAMEYSYSIAMTAFMTRPSNLYSIQLRPREQDHQSSVVNPAFTIERRIDHFTGSPLSALYNAMETVYPRIIVGQTDPRTRLTNAVVTALPQPPLFTDIQQVLGEQCQMVFGLTIDFTQTVDGSVVEQSQIDRTMGFGDDLPPTPTDHIDALLGTCAPNLFDSIPISLFYQNGNSPNPEDKVERLSILTQFFLANINIYCRSKGISAQNFGAILDASIDLSNELVDVVSRTLRAGDDVEMALCTFCNVHAEQFRLSCSLNAEDITTVKQKFERTYRTVTATKENPHMDDFMILDKEATGETAKFVTHQGAICVNFAEIVEPFLPNQDYFAHIREDFALHPAEIPHKNEWVSGAVDMDPEVLMTRIMFEELPDAVKMCLLLPCVAKGKQNTADSILTALPANKRDLLITPGVFTDYSGRTFNCTAYEYAYWAKDAHMCRMLERHMGDDATKAEMLMRIDAIERDGLTYQQEGQEHCSAHFDLTPLKDALREYIAGYDNWKLSGDNAVMAEAWMNVGLAQRDVPAHVAQEYCNQNRSFWSGPSFNVNEYSLPRTLECQNYTYDGDNNKDWYPLAASSTSGLGLGLGFDFAFVSAGLWSSVNQGTAASVFGQGVEPATIDLRAVSHLDNVRTIDLTRSRMNLLPTDLSDLEPMQNMSI